MGREPAAGDVPSPNPKPKKRVDWHATSGGAGDGDSDGDGDGDVDGARSRSPLTSPGRPPAYGSPAGFDARELRLALTKVLSDEREQCHLRNHDSPPIPVIAEPLPAPVTALRTPRPALRRNTSYDAPEERKMADWAEQRATQRQLRSLTDARQRADLLAMSVSAPDSRRSSIDAAFQPIVDHDDAASSRPRTPRHDDDHATAETLIRSHTVRHRAKDLFHRPKSPSTPGTQTPTLHWAHSQDYVPRPSKYRGGILSLLLKLYNDDSRRPGAGSNISGYNIPSSHSTPVMSPFPSPPPSRPASTVSGRGLFGSQRALSSTTSLSELIKSSSMFAAPGAGEMHDQWADKLRRERPGKPKKEQIRITVHIAGIISRHRYLLKLCRALMMYGAPTHRLEEYMTMSSRVLEIEGQFLYIPSCMLVSFDDSTTHTTEVKLVRVPQGIDLGKLRDVHNVYKDVVHDKLGVDEATRRLDEVMQRRPKFHIWLRVPVYGVASACVAPFAFEGRLIDLPVAFILGCIVGLLQLVFAPSNELYAHVFEISAAVITSFLARGFGSIHQGHFFCFSALAQSSIALILPGYMVLCSSLELQSHNIVAGSVRMVHAMIYTLFLGYGITIGTSLYGMMDKNAASETTCQAPLSRGWYFLFVPGFTLCLCVINQAKWSQTPIMTVMALAGFCVNSYCRKYFEKNTQISSMLGALTVGILANLYSRLGRHVENFWLDVVEWWRFRVRPRLTGRRHRRGLGGGADAWSTPSLCDDPESRPAWPEKPRKVGYSLAAAAMLPAIFVQVPSGLAAGGSLLAGVTSANVLNGNASAVESNVHTLGNLDGTAFNVLFSVIQVAIGISVGLFMSALIVYPLGKRRSGLFSF